MNIIELILDEQNIENGIEAISVVENPAIEEDFIALNGFDERYFLYMEDVDICKKIDLLGKKKLYYPQEQIIHILKQGSLKNANLFFSHLSSAIKYFLKWGF